MGLQKKDLAWRVGSLLSGGFTECLGESKSKTFCPHSGRAVKVGTSQPVLHPLPGGTHPKARPRLLKCREA